MLSQPNLGEIKKIAEDFFEKTTFDVEVDVFEEEENTFLINLKTETPQLLIGENGQSLAEIQYLLNTFDAVPL